MPRSRPDDFVPPYPAYTSRFPADQRELVLALTGVQSVEPHAGEARVARLLESARASAPGRPQHVERARHVDAAGWHEQVLLLYWRDAREMQAFWERDDVRAWLDEPPVGPVGWWRETLRAPVTATDANYSLPEGTWGCGRHVPRTEEQFHGYYGSMRDRTPDFLEGKADGAPGVLAPLPQVASLGRRLRVHAPDKVCFIRGVVGWEDARPEEQRAFIEDMLPVYEAGALFLRDHPVETGCISARLVEEVHDGASNGVQSETLAWFLTLADLERWTHHHPTHAAIYGGVFRLMKRFDFKMRLNLGHEVVVVPRGGATLEYYNCHPRTGFLPFFPGVPF